MSESPALDVRDTKINKKKALIQTARILLDVKENKTKIVMCFITQSSMTNDRINKISKVGHTAAQMNKLQSLPGYTNTTFQHNLFSFCPTFRAFIV